MSRDIQSEIRSSINQIEENESVRILLAVESGSRAWGFESADSDYDVRFIYIHSPEWYLSIDQTNQRDVIELPIEDDLDVNGWDIRKTLTLYRKSNPPLLEWLGSPIVYKEASTFADDLRKMSPRYYSPVACRFHYLHMAQNNFKEHLMGPTVRVKRYFYVLRPLLALRWIERDMGVVPTEFQTLVDSVLEEIKVKKAIDILIEEKKRGAEKDDQPRIEPISLFIEEEFKRLTTTNPTQMPELPSVEELNVLFSGTLDQVWQ